MRHNSPGVASEVNGASPICGGASGAMPFPRSSSSGRRLGCDKGDCHVSLAAIDMCAGVMIGMPFGQGATTRSTALAARSRGSAARRNGQLARGSTMTVFTRGLTMAVFIRGLTMAVFIRGVTTTVFGRGLTMTIARCLGCRLAHFPCYTEMTSASTAPSEKQNRCWGRKAGSICMMCGTSTAMGLRQAGDEGRRRHHRL